MSGNLSSVEEETDDDDDSYEDHHIPVKIEAFYHRGCVAHRIATMRNNGLYDLRRANRLRYVTGVAGSRDLAPIIRVGDIVRVD